MAHDILMFWRQARGGVLMFATGEGLTQGQVLQLGFGPGPRYDYSVAAIYKPEEPAALIEQYYNVWEPVLDGPQVAEIRAGIQRVRANAAVCLAYLLKLEGVHQEQPPAPVQPRPMPGNPQNN